MRRSVIRAVFCVLMVLISGCLAVETVTPGVENETAVDQPQDVNDTVLVSLGDRQLTMEQVKWALRDTDPKKVVRFVDFWIQMELLYEEAQRRGITEHGEAAFLAELDMKKRFGPYITRSRDVEMITDKELKDYYNKNKLTDPATYIPAVFSFSHIRVKTQKEAENVIKLIKNGEDFNELAKKISIAKDASRGGKIPKREHGMIERVYGKAFFEALERAKVGQVTGPVQVDDCYEIIRLERHTPKKLRPYEKIKNNLRAKLLRERRKAAFDDLMKELKEKTRYTIEKSDAFLKMEQEVESQ